MTWLEESKLYLDKLYERYSLLNENKDPLISKLQDYPESDYVAEGLLVLNKETGRYDCQDPSRVNIKKLIKNGKFILPLGVWNGDFDCKDSQLTSLQGAPQKVDGYFYCFNNQLTSLEGAPQKVGGNFYCFNNKLASLQGSPQKVDGNFYCGHNQLTSLEGAPQEVSGTFYCSNNPGYPFEGEREDLCKV